MDLKQLQAIGAIVPLKLFKREILVRRPELKPRAEWPDPEVPERTGEYLDESMTVHIRKGSSADAIEVANASARERPFVAIYRSICDEKGAPVFPDLETTMQLETWLVVPLFNAINEVQVVGSKNSQPRTSSGVSSRSPSAAGRSKSGKRRSRSTSN
jgi:hypothetical protein